MLRPASPVDPSVIPGHEPLKRGSNLLLHSQSLFFPICHSASYPDARSSAPSVPPRSGYALISGRYLQKTMCRASLFGLPEIASR